MEHMINTDLILKLRKERSWSQDHLASVSGLSLRTIQRIENEGSCSLDSKKALATTFEINATDLDINPAEIHALATHKRNRKLGHAGAITGLVCAYIGITASYASGGITPSEAGLYYGGIGAFFGISCAIVAVLSNRRIGATP